MYLISIREVEEVEGLENIDSVMGLLKCVRVLIVSGLFEFCLIHLILSANEMFSVRVKTFKFLGTNILIEHLTWTHNTQQIINDSSS